MALRHVRLALVGAALLLLSDVAGAATFHVAVTGDDAHAGTADSPWRTIQKCANALSAGDTCLVANGVYSENVTVSRSGSAGNPLQFAAATAHGAVVRGRLATNGSYIRIDGFKVLLRDGDTFGIALNGSDSEVAGNLISTESVALGINNTALTVSGTRNRAVSNRIERTCFGITASGSSHVLEGNDISALKMNGRCGDVDYVRFFGPNHVIRNNSLHGINRADTGVAHVDCFQNFDNNGPQFSATNVLIEGNLCSDADQGVILSSVSYFQSAGVTIRNNVFTRVSAWCVLVTDVSDVRLFNNTCDTTGGFHGLWCRGTHNRASCEFKNNILYGTGSLYGVMETAAVIDGDPSTPGKNNLLYKPGAIITGYPADTKNVDPMFANRAAADYHIGPTSPAIDAALAVGSWPTPRDKDGTPRPQGAAWDIGAYEYVGPPAPPTSVLVVE